MNGFPCKKNYIPFKEIDLTAQRRQFPAHR